MKFVGFLTYVSPKTEGDSRNGNHWEKLEFVVTEQAERYPNTLLFTAFGGEKIGKFVELNIGDLVEVDYDARVRDWTDSQGNARKSLDLSMYTIRVVGNQPAAPQPVAQPMMQPQPSQAAIKFTEEPPF